MTTCAGLQEEIAVPSRAGAAQRGLQGESDAVISLLVTRMAELESHGSSKERLETSPRVERRVFRLVCSKRAEESNGE